MKIGTSLNRRSFLKALAATGGVCIARGVHPGENGLAFALQCAGRRKVVVSIFLAGGAHGPSILVPRTSTSYIAKHPTLAITSPLVLDSAHGLNPAMTYLHGLYGAGKVVILNGAGFPNHSRSHEDATMMVGRGMVGTSPEISGWAGRYAKLNCDPSEIFSLFSFRGKPTEVIAPGVPVASASSLSNYRFIDDSRGPNHNPFVREVIQNNRLVSGISNDHEDAMVESWGTASASIAAIGAAVGSYSAYVGTPAYPTTGIGPRMQDAARLIVSSTVPVQHVFISQGGYDTHENQATALPGLLQNLDQSIAAFWADMNAKGRQNDVIVMFYTEFGRTHENLTLGTDHGQGAIMCLVGNNLRGGVASPAYTNADFDNSARPWVPVKLDMREVLEQVLNRHQGVDTGPIFPETFSRIGLNLFV